MRISVSVNDGPPEVFDSWRCVLDKLAPVCSSCGGHVLGDGVLIGDALLCSDRCAARWRIPVQQSGGTGEMMHAHVGDRIVVRGHHVDEVARDADVLEVRSSSGAPPYVVRWSDDGHVGLFYPGPDTYVDAPEPASAPPS